MSGKSHLIGRLRFSFRLFSTAVLFGGAGVLAYLTFGDQVQTVVIVNLDPRSKMVQAVSPSWIEVGIRVCDSIV